MTTDDTFGQHLDGWLHEEAGHRVPDHLDEVLVQTAADAPAAVVVEPRKVASRGHRD